MKATVIPGRLLESDHLRRWRAFTETNSLLASPFLRPEFTCAVSAVRDDVRVGIFEEGGQLVGFLPFQASPSGTAVPAGGHLNDLQAVISEQQTEWSGAQLIRACGLRTFRFTRVPASMEAFRPFHRRRKLCAFIDVSTGYDAYADEKQREGTRQLRYIDAISQKLHKEVGPLQFVPASRDVRALETLLSWKSDRYSRQGYVNDWMVPWSRALLSELLATDGPEFGGLLSLLYAGDHLVAAHFGLRTREVWHYWLPAYSAAFARFSPGLVLLMLMARHAPAIGVRAIELGEPEDYLYKQRLMNRTAVVASGTVDATALAAFVRRAGCQAEDWARQSRFIARPARALMRTLRRAGTGGAGAGEA